MTNENEKNIFLGEPGGMLLFQHGNNVYKYCPVGIKHNDRSKYKRVAPQCQWDGECRISSRMRTENILTDMCVMLFSCPCTSVGCDFRMKWQWAFVLHGIPSPCPSRYIPSTLHFAAAAAEPLFKDRLGLLYLVSALHFRIVVKAENRYG